MIALKSETILHCGTREWVSIVLEYVVCASALATLSHKLLTVNAKPHFRRCLYGTREIIGHRRPHDITGKENPTTACLGEGRPRIVGGHPLRLDEYARVKGGFNTVKIPFSRCGKRDINRISRHIIIVKPLA